jgi:hypothetical protein
MWNTKVQIRTLKLQEGVFISVLLVFNHFILCSFKYFPPKCIILCNLIIKRLLYCNYSYFYIRSCMNLHSISASRMLLRSNVMIWKYNALFLFKITYVCCLFCMCVCVCVLYVCMYVCVCSWNWSCYIYLWIVYIQDPILIKKKGNIVCGNNHKNVVISSHIQ